MKSRRNRAVTALVTVTAVIAAAVLVAGPGYQNADVRMLAGAVWLASTRTGEATLLDGASAEVKAHVQIAEAGTSLEVAQWGGTAVALNRETGEFRTVDSATERVSPPVEVLPASDGLIVLPAAQGLYVIDVRTGLAAVVDPATMTPRGEPVKLAESIRPDSVVTDARGRLWAIDDTSGDLVWLDGDRKRNRTGVAKGGRLAIAHGRPALVDSERGTVELLDPETGRAEESVRPNPPAGAAVAVGGSDRQSRVHLVIGDRGELVTCSFGTGACSEPVRVGSAGTDFGRPVEVDGHVVVPDYSTGQAAILDLTGSRPVVQRQLFDHPTRFELLVRDGIVFFNDANGDRAGVLELSGEVRAVTKYTGKPADDVPPLQHDTSGQPDQAVKVGNDTKKPASVGVPGRDVRPSRAEPRPGPVAASIIVKPGPRGVVGDEFDLTVVVPSAPGAATTVWQFGDGAGATGGTVRHSWKQPGTFTVRAVSTLGGGVRAEAETTVIVDPAGTPNRITELNVQRPRPVMGESLRFSAGTTAKPDGWDWTITKNGSTTPEVTARTAEFSHTFADPGIYTLALTITTGERTTRSSREFKIARGAVKGWGYNNYGESAPPLSASSGVMAIAAGSGHALALKSNGSVIAWGAPFQGVTTIPPPAWSGVVAIAAGGHNMVLKDDGSVFAWGGGNFAGQLNVPEEAQRDVIAISAGSSHSLALRADGRVVAWGYKGDGAVDVPAEALSGVIAIAAGSATSMALKADRSVVIWGKGCVTQTPVTDAVAIAAGSDVCLAVKRNGSVFAWGDTRHGEDLVPPGAMSGVVSVEVLAVHALALKADGTAIGWGMDDRGQATVPPQINKGVLAVSVGAGFSLALLEDLE